MDSPLTQTPREKLEAWLRYYSDLNLGEFYLDRRSMEKHTVKPRTTEAVAPSPNSATTPLPLAAPRPAISVPALAIVNPPSLFEALYRVEGHTLELIRENLGECTRCRLHKQRHEIAFCAGHL